MSLIASKSGMQDLVICAAPSYLAERPMPQSPHDLGDHHYITHLRGRHDDARLFVEDEGTSNELQCGDGIALGRSMLRRPPLLPAWVSRNFPPGSLRNNCRAVM